MLIISWKDYSVTNAWLKVKSVYGVRGRSLGYKLGMIKILELREKAKAALGDKFNIRDFHDVVIGTGALPLPILAKQVDKYFAKVGK